MLLLLGYWFVVWAAAMWSSRPWVENDAGKRYLWWTSGLMFVVFLGFSVKTRGGEPNWPIAGYVGGLVLTGGWLAQQLDSAGRWRRLTLVGLGGACFVSLSVTLLMHRSDLIYPLLARAAGPATAQQQCPIRRLDPTCSPARLAADTSSRCGRDPRTGGRRAGSGGHELGAAGRDWFLLRGTSASVLGRASGGGSAQSVRSLAAESDPGQRDISRPDIHRRRQLLTRFRRRL